MKPAAPSSSGELENLTVPLFATSSSSSSSSSSGGAAPSEPAAYFLIKKTVYPPDADQTKRLITTFDHTFHAGTDQVQ